MHILPFHKQYFVFSIYVNLYQFYFLLYLLSSLNLKTYDLEYLPHVHVGSLSMAIGQNVLDLKNIKTF